MPRKRERKGDQAPSKAELEEVIPEEPGDAEVKDSLYLVDVTVGYSRKLNLSAHGGNQFETLDIHESRTAKGIIYNEADKIRTKLFNACKENVEETIKEYDAYMASELDPVKKKEKKKDTLGVDKDELEGIAHLIQQLIDAKDMKEMEAVQEAIKAEKKDLNEFQLEYLRTKYSDKAKKLKK